MFETRELLKILSLQEAGKSVRIGLIWLRIGTDGGTLVNTVMDLRVI
jgi:hypothetical protein